MIHPRVSSYPYYRVGTSVKKRKHQSEINDVIYLKARKRVVANHSTVASTMH